MSAPKSVVKLHSKNGKTEVTYTSDVEAADYYLHELSRAAMRDLGKFVCRAFRDEYYQHFDRETKSAGKATRYQVIAGAKTKYPRVKIGLKPKDG